MVSDAPLAEDPARLGVGFSGTIGSAAAEEDGADGVSAVVDAGWRRHRGGGAYRTAEKMGLQTETLILPYVINQTLIQGWIWAFQAKGYLMVQESALYNEVLLFFLK